ncbi:transcription factor with AP2 domain(s), putative [Plasmodium vivax]|uniref:Transcription factor with AP2 domain(S), putative n=1 Tax=Plasmodium vivax TaxID=5855 RepID=A0A1G4GRR8_PLAVI|nr:transcription factor with AP2 domain(s), putative [Plasmodium vivax]
MDGRKCELDARCDELRTGNEETPQRNPSNVGKDYVGGCVKINLTASLDLKDKEKEVNPWGEKRGTHCKLNEDGRSEHRGGASDVKDHFEKSVSCAQVNLSGGEQEGSLSSRNDLHDQEGEREKEKAIEKDKEKTKDGSQINQRIRTHVICTGGRTTAPSPQQQRGGESKRIDLPPVEKKNPHDGGTSRGNTNMISSGDQRRSGVDGLHISAREQNANRASTNLGTWCNWEVSVNDQVSSTRGVPKEGAHLREAIRVPSVGADDNADEEAQKECTVVQGGSNLPHGNEEQEEERKTNPIMQQSLAQLSRNNCMNRSGSYVQNGEKHNLYEQNYPRSANLEMNLVGESHLDEKDRRGNVPPGGDSDWVSTLNRRETPQNVEDHPRGSCPVVKDTAHLRKNPHGEEETREGSSKEDTPVGAIFHERYIPPVSCTDTRETADNIVETNRTFEQKERSPSQVRVGGAPRRYNPGRDLSTQRSEDNIHTICSLSYVSALQRGNQNESKGGRSLQVGCNNVFISIDAGITEITQNRTAEAPNGGTPKLPEPVRQNDNQLGIPHGEIKKVGKDNLEGYPSGEGDKTNVGEADLEEGPNGAVSHERVTLFPCDVTIGMISSGKIGIPAWEEKNEAVSYKVIENEKDAHLADGNEERFSCEKREVVRLDGAPPSAPPVRENSQEGRSETSSATRIGKLDKEAIRNGVERTVAEGERKKKDSSPEICKVNVDVSKEVDEKSRGNPISPCRGSEHGFTSQDLLSRSKYIAGNQLVGVLPSTLVSLGYTPDAHGVARRTSRTRFGERKGIHMVDAKWSEGGNPIVESYQRSGNIPMGTYPNGHEEIVTHRDDAFSSFEKEMNSALLDLHKEGADDCQDNFTQLGDCKKKKKRTGIPLNERKYYRVLAKQMIKIQGLTFDHNQIRWIAYWKNENNKQIQKHFPVCKYGFYKARQLALEFRNSKFDSGGQAVRSGAVGGGAAGVGTLGGEAETIQRVTTSEVDKQGGNTPQSGKKSSHKKDAATPKVSEPTQKGSQTTETRTKNKRKDPKVGMHNPRKRSGVSRRRVHLGEESGGVVANASHAEGTTKEENEPKDVDEKSNLKLVNKRINTSKGSVYGGNSPAGRSSVGSFSGGGHAGMRRHDLKNVPNVVALQNGGNLNSMQNSPHSTISRGFPAFAGGQVVGGVSGPRGCIGGSGHSYDQGTHATTEGQTPNRHAYATGPYGPASFYKQNGMISTGPHGNAWGSTHGRTDSYTYMVNNFAAMPSGHNIGMAACRRGLPSEAAYLSHGISGEVLPKGQFTDSCRSVAYQNPMNREGHLNRVRQSPTNQLSPFFGANYGGNSQTVTGAAVSSNWGGHTPIGSYIDGSNFHHVGMKNQGGGIYSPRFGGQQSGSPQHMRSGTYQYSMSEGRAQVMGSHFNRANKVADGTWNRPCEEGNGENPSDNLTMQGGVKNALEGQRVRSSATSSGSGVGGMGGQGIVKTDCALPEGDNSTEEKQQEGMDLSLNVNLHSRVGGERSERETWNLTRASTATHISEHLSELVNVSRSAHYERSQGGSLPSEGAALAEVIGLRNTGDETTRGKANVLGNPTESFGRRVNSPEQWISIHPMEKAKVLMNNASVESGEAGRVTCGHSEEGVPSACVVDTACTNQERKKSERNVSGKSKGKKSNSVKKANRKGGKSCSDVHIRGSGMALLCEGDMPSRSCQWYGEDASGEVHTIGGGEHNQGGISNGGVVKESKKQSRKKSAKRKKEKNELDVAHLSGKQNRSECNQISDANNKGNEEASCEESGHSKWTHSMGVMHRKAIPNEEPKKAAIYGEGSCASEKQLDPCGQLNRLTQNSPFSVPNGEPSVPRGVFPPSDAQNDENGSVKGTNELAKKETAENEEGEEEMYTYKPNQLEKNSCNDHDEDEYYYSEILKMPKIKGVHFDIRQKRWCAYGHKKKECFSVYRYGFLIARELAVKSRLKVQKRKNSLKLKKNKNCMNGESGCDENGGSSAKKRQLVGDKQTHSSDQWEVSHLPYDGTDGNGNPGSLNDYTGPPSPIGSAECTPTPNVSGQKGDPMGSSTPTGGSHEKDEQREDMGERTELWNGAEVNANLFPIRFEHSRETESLKGPRVSGGKLRAYNGREASAASGASGARQPYGDNPYGGCCLSPDSYANRSYTGVPIEVDPTRRYYTGEVGSRGGSGTHNVVPLPSMVHHSGKDKHFSYQGSENRMSSVNRVEEPFAFNRPNEQICLSGQVKRDNFYGAYDASGGTNQMMNCNLERGASNPANMGNVERGVLRGANNDCQSYGGGASWYSVARANGGMQKMGSVPIGPIPIGAIPIGGILTGGIPVGPAPPLGNGAMKSNLASDEALKRLSRIALLNEGHFANRREHVSGNEVISTQGGFPLGVGAALPIDAKKTCVPEMQQRSRANNRTHRSGLTDGTSQFVHNREVAILEPVVESKPNKKRPKKDVVQNGYWGFIDNWGKGTTGGSDQGGGTDLATNGVAHVNNASLGNNGGTPFFEANGGSMGGATPTGGGEFETVGGRSGVSIGAANEEATRVDGMPNVGGHFLGLSPSPQHAAPQNMLPQFPHVNSTQVPFLQSWGAHQGKNLPSGNISTGMNANQWGIRNKGDRQNGGRQNGERQNDAGRVIHMSETNFLQNDMNRGGVKNYSAVRSVEPFGVHHLMGSTPWRGRNVQSDCSKGRMASCMLVEEKTNYEAGKEPHLQYDQHMASIRSGYPEYAMHPCVDVSDPFVQNGEYITHARRNYGGDASAKLLEEGKKQTDKHSHENEKKFLHKVFQDNRNIGRIEVGMKNNPVGSGLQKSKRLNFEEVNMFHAEVREPIVSGNSVEVAAKEHKNGGDYAKQWVQLNGEAVYYDRAVSYDRVDVGKTDRKATNKGVKIMKREKKKKRKKEHITPQGGDHIFHSLDAAHVKCEEKQTRSNDSKRSKNGFANFRGSNETCATAEEGAQVCLLLGSTLEGNEGASNGAVAVLGTTRSDAGGRRRRRSEVVGKNNCGKEKNAQLSISRGGENLGGASLAGMGFNGRGAQAKEKKTPKGNNKMLDATTTGEEGEKHSQLHPRRGDFPLLQNQTGELICQGTDPYGGMVVTTQGGSPRHVNQREEQKWDPFVFFRGTGGGGQENILCDDHGEVVLHGGSPYGHCSSFSRTNGESPQRGIKCEQLKGQQINPLEESPTVSRFETPYGGEQSGRFTEEAANGVVLNNVDASSADRLPLSANRSNAREVNHLDVLAGALRERRFDGGSYREVPNCHLGRGAEEKASTDDVHRFEADRMMAAAEVFLNGDYFGVCGDVPLPTGPPPASGMVSDGPGGGQNEWNRHSRKRDGKKGTILKNVHIVKEYGERFPPRGAEEGGVPCESAADGNTSGEDSLLDRFCLFIFGSMKVSELVPMHCVGTEMEEVLLAEPYREDACLSLHDLNINRAKDVIQTIHFKKLILKYLLMDLFRNTSVPEFSKMTADRTHFLVNPQKCASSYPLTSEIDKSRDLLQRVERYHLKFVNNIYDQKIVQMYWDVFVTCLVKNVTASVLPFEEHCMVMRSLLLLYLDGSAPGGASCK